jgi:UDP-N-acetylglucosamine diphosphorylase/glucosamine-1-phosphate N-acetyltransferase
MAIILFDNQYRQSLQPITTTKAIGDIRLGILKIKEWWQILFQQPVYIITEQYLQPLYTLPNNDEHIFIDASVLPNEDLINKINTLNAQEAIIDDIGIIAGKATIQLNTFNSTTFEEVFTQKINYKNLQRIQKAFHFFQLNEQAIQAQFLLITKNRQSQKIATTNQVINKENIFIEEGATVEHCILNASTGFIYIGKNAQIMEGSIIRGHFALCENAVIKAGTKIYGATTIGIHATAGGEIKNAIISDYSNKAHDGYLGDSFLGEWCNIGAGTSNSNVKNNARDVMFWNNYLQQKVNAGKKCGVVMGDYSRTAINTAINTGSNIGVCCNVFGVGFIPTVLNNFSWGTDKNNTYTFDKAIDDINNWKQFKGKQISSAEVKVLKYIFEHF